MSWRKPADRIVIAFDTEFTREGTGNRILAYQYAGRSVHGEWSGVLYPKSHCRDARLSLAELLGAAFEEGRRLRLIRKRRFPKELYITAHFSRADLSAFRDFPERKREFDNVRSSFATALKTAELCYTDRHRNQKTFKVRLFDTMLLAPNGKSLDAVGELYGLPKLELPEGFSKDRMDLFLAQAPEAFEAYAKRDAEIGARHFWEIASFAYEALGMTRPPITLGSIATRFLIALWKANAIDHRAVLGVETVWEQVWNPTAGAYRSRKRDVPTAWRNDHEALAVEAYHGGRNETYVFGFTPRGVWTDFDLAGAYTTAMAALGVPDFARARVCHDLARYTPETLGLARVRFEFPQDTRFPCLPVRTDHGLVFPLAGTTTVAAPEIALARSMGAEVVIEHGVIVPWAGEVRPFELFVQAVQARRKGYPKGSLNELLWKEIGNSLYGKLAQGLHPKRVYNTRSEMMEPLPPSRITQPYLAAYVTSLVRAVLGELLARIPALRTVTNATTDGLLTDATRAEIDTGGPLCRFFSALRVRLGHAPEILEAKHGAAQVLAFKTRGQATAQPLEDMPLVLAKAGIKPPRAMDKAAQNAFLTNLFRDRTAQTALPVESFIPLSEQCRHNLDLTRQTITRRVNMDYDFKRALTAPTRREGHLYADSRPWPTAGDFLNERRLFDQWRKDHQGVLKTLEDWQAWQDYRALGPARRQGLRARGDGPLGLARRTFLRAYAQGAWGLPGGAYPVLAAWLTGAGYPTTVTELKNAKRLKLVEGAVPAAEDVLALVAVIRQRFPGFEAARLLQGAPPAPPAQITVLFTAGPVLAKQFLLEAGRVVSIPYDHGYLFRHREFPVADIHALGRLLETLRRYPTACVIRGRAVEGLPQDVRRLSEHFPDTGQPWVLIDFDRLPLPEGVDPLSREALRHALATLPPEFRETTAVVKFSSSAGVLDAQGRPLKPGFNANVWFWLSRPVVREELKAWLGATPADAALFRPVQPHYTADPVLGEGVGCAVTERLFTVPGARDVVTVPADLAARRRAWEQAAAVEAPAAVGAYTWDTPLHLAGGTTTTAARYRASGARDPVRCACPVHGGQNPHNAQLFPSGLLVCHSECDGARYRPQAGAPEALVHADEIQTDIEVTQ